MTDIRELTPEREREREREGDIPFERKKT